MCIECDRCKQSFPEEDLVFFGADTLCKWCSMELEKKKAEDENKLTYAGIAKFIDMTRRLGEEDDDGDDV